MAFFRSLGGPSLITIALCSACGSSFDASGIGDAGGGGVAGQPGAAGNSGGDEASGGDTSAAGSANSGSGGMPGAAGEPNAGTGGTAAGSGGSGPGAGGNAGGPAAGGGAGNGGAPDCVGLKAEYSAALERARVCDAGSTDECSTGTTLPAIGCGCPTLVNGKSEFTALAKRKYQAFQDGKCNSGAICNIGCIPPTSASCAPQPAASGKGYVCSGATLAVN